MDELNQLSTSENNEIEFYNFIVGITKYSNCESILKKDSQEIFDVITKDYKKNIQLSATTGSNSSYICIYEASAKYKGLIPIDNFVRMTNSMEEKFNTFKIEPVLNKLKKRLHPFTVEVKNIHEIDKNVSHDSNIICITVSWTPRDP